ncbi:MAG: COX15/CtaA family protein [Microcella pacifica]|uniref:COX15/CtaA family protein n=1 Tax=Microcella pacifica TaxID=2591847 RepID=UPI003315E5BD
MQTVNRLWQWFPTTIDRRVRVIAWASLVSQILIVGTGGAVRLTGSGLGCPTWPRCTDDSFVATPEMGIHGIVEFGNRLLTFVLIVIALLAFLFVVRMRRERPELLRLTLALGLGIIAQAIIGGITVLTGLNSWIVGLHFVVSSVLVALAAVLVHRVYHGRATSRLAVPPPVRLLALATAVGVWVTVLVGIVVTGSGPHAGDADTPRNGLDPAVWQHVHSWPAYITAALSVLLLVAAMRVGHAPLRRAVLGLLAVEAVQMAVGLAQARLGLPELLVGTHMVLACVLVAALTHMLLTLRVSEGSATRSDARDQKGSSGSIATPTKSSVR